MKKWAFSIAAAAGLALAAPVAFAEDISMSQLPDQVRQTVEREAGQAQIGDVERDDENGQTVYEIELIENGQKFELDVGEDGRLLQRHPD